MDYIDGIYIYDQYFSTIILQKYYRQYNLWTAIEKKTIIGRFSKHVLHL